ncbi:hypothetical protein SODALDRAFT_220933 [Sodiomyces alkalinus F11]|uniref:Exocyst complex component Sec3 PIP2-binding N-terminal domain-containing protein n=1 Tax=Sodiomyces alkalinus (strain CBS 110278 / VKM F-3762 / F11) TaxID=1314773 RepID=A0A3N2PPT9_SODAK|nr:hypothetical protein SODALDRAFT_220933 [Sodiomyces alkalinus F11]ROT36515.1 hypothetical protein SODALDRAFT_220933 [Sodiomyces alkalinus F11]
MQSHAAMDPRFVARIEDEKRRIIDSCFSKKDVDNSFLETYISHVRITEFSSHQSVPPPPQARVPESEKRRVIILSVRKTGRVHMHKSKENANGTFSIGKTWHLADLTAIGSFTGPPTSAAMRERAGDTGFTVTIGKTYFWDAQSEKQKRHFIATLIKVYGRYTQGHLPDLVGFDPRELDLVIGSRRPPPQQRPPMPKSVPTPLPIPPNPSAPPSGPPSAPPSGPLPQQPVARPHMPEPSQSSLSNLSVSSSANASSTYPSLPSPSPGRRPPPPRQNGGGSPAGSLDSSRSQPQPQNASQLASIRRLAGGNKSQDSVAASLATTRSDDASSLPPRSRNGVPGPGAFGRFETPDSVPSSAQPPQPPQLPQQPQQPSLPPPPPDERERPPERRRPPMDPLRPQASFSERDLVPAPLMSPGLRREPVAPPPRSRDRVAPTIRSVSQQRSEVSSARDRPVTPASIADRPVTPGSSAAAAAAAVVMPDPTPASPMPVVDGAGDVKTARNGSVSAASSTAALVPAPTEPPAEPAPSPSPSSPPPEPSSEENRPGLGPMIKSKKSKGEIAGTFWKAAAAVNAFKPRPGGAGEKLRQVQSKTGEEGSDGITGVFKPPSRPKTTEADASHRAADATTTMHKGSDSTPSLPKVQITVPDSSRPTSLQAAAQEVRQPAKDVTDDEAKNNSKSEAKEDKEAPPRKPLIAGNDAKYLTSLGVDASILDNRSTEFTKWLDFFGWVPGEQMRSRHLDEMRVDVDRELNEAQAGGWLARFREDDERVEAIKRGIDVAIAECEEVDNLLTLYSVELGTLSEDIAYIEAQGQGLQVQTANQKTLKKELESLLETTTITSDDLVALKTAPLESIAGLEDIEAALVTLYKAMIKIDPTLGGDQSRRSNELGMDTQMEMETTGAEPDQSMGLGLGLDNSDYGKMRIVREKKEMYVRESSLFVRRLVEYMARQFNQAATETTRAQSEALSRKADAKHHDAGRDVLWKYSPLVLYTRDVDAKNWDRLLQLYQDFFGPVYKREFEQIMAAWKKNARKVTADDTADLLFTSHAERKEEGIATTARRLTVKRSQTLAKTLRTPLDGGKSSSSPRSSESLSLPYEVFASVLDDVLPLVAMEQNFVVDFFHASTLEQADFPDAVAAFKPRDRMGGDLRRHRLMEPDRELARRVAKVMEVMFSFLEQELSKLMNWVILTDSLQGVGILAALEQKMADISQSNQDFLNSLLQKLHSVLESRFKKFVDEQIRAIEETKVKINKRKGVISFIRVFPHFSGAVENILSTADRNLEVRGMVDREYDRILKSMFDSLKIIARENPAVAVNAGSTADPEDKEALNFHILLIENAHHFLEEVDARGLDVLDDWRVNATAELAEHMQLYIGAVMRRPLGRLLEYLENIEAQLASGKPATSVAAQPSNAPTVFSRVLASYDAKEVRKGVEALRKRVEKHFGDADDPALGRHLVVKVLRECERFYGDVELRISRVNAEVYGGDVQFEWPRAEVKSGFAAR